MSVDSFLAQNIHFIAAAAAVLAACAVGCLIALLVRPRPDEALQGLRDRLLALEQGTARTDGLLREETARMRDEAGTRGRELREELGGVGDRLHRGLEGTRAGVETRMDGFARTQSEASERLRAEIGRAVTLFGEGLKGDIAKLMDAMTKGQAAFQGATRDSLGQVEQRVAALSEANEQRQTALRQAIEQRLEQLRTSNEHKLDQMRHVVDEKLHATLEKRLGESFAIVSERLEKVHHGLGEMQVLATGVGDLKKVLANVKDRGGWAEVQLGMMLENMLHRDQYDVNVQVDPTSGERVEYVVRFPGQDAESEVWLPIDAKFPQADYERLVAAMEAGDGPAIRTAQADLARVLEAEAKKISSKYIRTPRTTDFAVMYLPTEGLFAEAMRQPGLATRFQAQYRVTVAGPTTLAALLNSFQMGFRTLAIQKRSGEVWRVLGEAKSEFEKYGTVWERLKKQLETVQRTVDDAGTRARAVSRKLRAVELVDGTPVTPPQFELTLAVEEEVE